MATKVLEIRNLSVRYGAVSALENLNLTVTEGAIVTLLGGNGAGKSTTLRALSGLVRPHSGKIWFKGVPVQGLPPHQIVSLGLAQVPEGRLVFSNLTVCENLAMGAFLDEDPKRRARNQDFCLGLFPRLRERYQQIAGTLSGGEQQMLAISRALMSNPKLLMLDEPSLGIAPRLVTSIFEKILEINRSHGLSLLLVEQNAHLALDISHYAYVLESGRLVAEGSRDSIRDNEALKKAYLGA